MPTNPPNTLVRTSHAVTIRANGLTVGLLQTFSPSQNRQITPIYEINAATSGEPLENVPGNLGGLTIGVSRYDLYTKRMEEAFGTPNSAMLSDHNNPFQALELYLWPDNTREGYIYTGCWFSSLGRNLSATDGRTILANGQIQYVRKLRII